MVPCVYGASVILIDLFVCSFALSLCLWVLMQMRVYERRRRWLLLLLLLLLGVEQIRSTGCWHSCTRCTCSSTLMSLLVKSCEDCECFLCTPHIVAVDDAALQQLLWTRLQQLLQQWLLLLLFL